MRANILIIKKINCNQLIYFYLDKFILLFSVKLKEKTEMVLNFETNKYFPLLFAEPSFCMHVQSMHKVKQHTRIKKLKESRLNKKGFNINFIKKTC